MSGLTIILCIWSILAFCGILFMRGASLRVERPANAPKIRRPSRYSIAE